MSVFCCLRNCLNGCGYNTSAKRVIEEPQIYLDTAFIGYEVVVVKKGQRVCGAGASLGNAPLVQSKSYFEVKVQQGGNWAVGLATRETNLNAVQGGMDSFSWALCSDYIVRHNMNELINLTVPRANNSQCLIFQEGDVIGVSYDHINLKFFHNGQDLDCALDNVKGTVYPALYVDDGAILDIAVENFTFPPPPGYEKIMLEQTII